MAFHFSCTCSSGFMFSREVRYLFIFHFVIVLIVPTIVLKLQKYSQSESRECYETSSLMARLVLRTSNVYCKYAANDRSAQLRLVSYGRLSALEQHAAWKVCLVNLAESEFSEETRWLAILSNCLGRKASSSDRWAVYAETRFKGNYFEISPGVTLGPQYLLKQPFLFYVLSNIVTFQ